MKIDANWSGIVTVTTAGTPVAGPDVRNLDGFLLQANSANTGLVYVLQNVAGKTTANSGISLAAGATLLIPAVNLNQVKFDAAVSGEKMRWCKA